MMRDKIYAVKSKIQNCRGGKEVAQWLATTPLFPYIRRVVSLLGIAEPPIVTGSDRQAVRRYFSENQSKIDQIVAALADDTSKNIFLNSIKCRKTGRYILKGNAKEQYFPKDIVMCSSEEVFVDCGACNGDTIEKFREITQNHYKKIVAFEPDPQYYQELIQRKIPYCRTFECATWDKKASLVFYANGEGTSVVGDVADKNEKWKLGKKEVIVSLDAIDNIPDCADMTFLKMDIEGAELNALKGAEKTIRKQHPKLAISIYHSDQDMLEIPYWILSLDMGYKLYIRHHDPLNYLADTVLYAI